MLVLGASGFIGANLLRTLSRYRDDVYGTASRLPAWRLEDLRSENIIVTDLLVDSNLDAMLDNVKPRTVFDCVGYGGYSFETDAGLIYETNFNLMSRLPLPVMCTRAVRPSTEITPPVPERTRRRSPIATMPFPKRPLPTSSTFLGKSGNCPASTCGFIRYTDLWKTLPA